MHEASLMNDLVNKILALAHEQQARQVIEVQVWLGALSHMSAEHFREHFSQAAHQTIAEGASLRIDCSDDIHDPNAQSLLLRGIEVDI